MKRTFAAVIGIALLATPAMAGDWRNDGCHGCGPGGWNGGPYYGRQPNGGYGYFPTPYGYINGGNGHRPPPPPVAVQPAWCAPRDMIFVPQFGKSMCKPVLVPRVQ